MTLINRVKSWFEKEPKALFTLNDINGITKDVFIGDKLWIVTKEKDIEIDATILLNNNDTLKILKAIGVIKGISYYKPHIVRVTNGETTTDTTKSCPSGIFN